MASTAFEAPSLCFLGIACLADAPKQSLTFKRHHQPPAAPPMTMHRHPPPKRASRVEQISTPSPPNPPPGPSGRITNAQIQKMRSSRISKDTSKLLGSVAATQTSFPRRTTRSLSRFAHTTSTTLDQNGPQTTDIEDSISPPRKRRRRRTPADSPTEAADAEPSSDPSPSAPSPPAKRRGRKPAKNKTDRTTGQQGASPPVPPPPDWQEVYNTVKKMRGPGGAAHGAAVDTMGCERLADPNASPRDQRFHTLIALMLSSQTKDTVNAVAMHRLRTELPPHRPGAPAGLNLDNVLAVDAGLLNELIWAVGFHNNKTKYIKRAAVMLRDQWKGDIPDTIEGLTSLPGVGPKMAYLCLSAAWGRTEGVGVDVHVHRITNLWGWNRTRSPEETRRALQSWLPRDKWREINWLLVGLGQTVCLPVGRRCGDCDLGLDGLCKAAERKKVLQGRRAAEEVEVEEASGVAVRRREVVAGVVVTKEEAVNGELRVGR
ncbi:DNA glycosylase [Metarhizium album ARSEF 1941]|uniref:Endonuclease III homolog n=1 Tax=Metarhizium album (strain ARSEF 1941) TaxID=1081103 RepID=A0A0B2WLI0_METAS|nr:DNA glycosylase [Metarhizium album ARSEF 1941]KHN96921.1 DNA glycosylase [Metarhizium album ARSEF 1941]